MSPRSALPPSLVLLAAVSNAAPAHAGRASACKAPPFSVPKETQRAVDAAIDARVTGTGAGGVSTAVETRTDYETTTLTQDAAARAWAEYTLCLKLAKKLISQNLHDELLRALLAPSPMSRVDDVPQVVPAVAPQEAAPSPALSPEGLAGTWQVTSTFHWSTCPRPNDVGGVNAYSWLLSAKEEGRVEARVLGTTSYPLLSGRMEGSTLVLTGELVRSPVDEPNRLFAGDGSAQVHYRPRVTVAVVGDGSALHGTRDLTTIAGPVASQGGTNQYELCTMHYEVEGHR